jgi:hypothetical protein
MPSIGVHKPTEDCTKSQVEIVELNAKERAKQRAKKPLKVPQSGLISVTG